MSAAPDSNAVALPEKMADAAVAVLGAMMNAPECVGPVLSRLDDSDFIWDKYRLVFQCIRQQFTEGKPVDGITVMERLHAAGVDVREFITQVRQLTPTAANVLEYADLLKEISLAVRLRDAGLRLSQAKSLAECREILDEANRLRVGRPAIRARTFSQEYEDFFNRHDSETTVPALSWDFPKLNEVHQFRLGHLVVLGAYPGVGKTALALQCAARFARDWPVGYYSWESTGGELYDRHVARTALVDSRKIRDNTMDAADYTEMLQMKSQLADPAVTLIDAAGMTAEDVIAHAMASHFRAVIVDYVQHVRGQTRGRRFPQSEYERVTEASMIFQDFAVRTQTSVLLLSQLTRPQKTTYQYKSADGKKEAKSITPPPTLSALRSSGQLEQDADAVLLLWRENDDMPDSPRILKVAKNRHGPSGGRLRLAFDGPHQQFTRLEETYSPQPRYQKKKPENSAQASLWDASDPLPGELPDDLPF